MDRRNFLRLTIGGVAAAAAVRTFPFRVYSFPSDVELVPVYGIDGGLPTSYLSVEMEKIKESVFTQLAWDNFALKKISVHGPIQIGGGSSFRKILHQ